MDYCLLYHIYLLYYKIFVLSRVTQSWLSRSIQKVGNTKKKQHAPCCTGQKITTYTKKYWYINKLFIIGGA